MEENKNEQTATVQTQTAEADIENTGEGKVEVSLGKFKDVGALVNAYNSLQAEFTKRCQRLKELESKIENSEKTSASQQQTNDHAKPNTTFIDKDEVLKEYLLEVLGKKPQAIVMNGTGVGVKAPVNRPKTIEEAGRLAKNLLNK